MVFLIGEWGETKLNVLVLKDPYYTIVTMLTFSGLNVPEGQKEDIRMVNGDVFKFKYTEVFADHYEYRGNSTTTIN